RDRGEAPDTAEAAERPEAHGVDWQCDEGQRDERRELAGRDGAEVGAHPVRGNNRHDDPNEVVDDRPPTVLQKTQSAQAPFPLPWRAVSRSLRAGIILPRTRI